MAVTVTIEKIGTSYQWKDAAFAWGSGKAKRSWENLSPLAYTIVVDEQISILESAARKAVYDRIFLAALDLQRENLKRISKNHTQQCMIEENLERKVRFMRTLLETVDMAGAFSKHFKRVYQEELPIKSYGMKKARKNIIESTLLHDFAEKNQIKNLVEHLDISMTPIKQTRKTFDDRFSLLDTMRKKSTKNTLEKVWVVENLLKEVVYHRLYTEKMQVTPKEAKRLQKNFQQCMNLAETYLRNANAVLSNLYYSNKELTFEEFKQIEVPVGFLPFRDFVIGDYAYEEAIFRMLLEGAVTAARPLATDWELNVDVPDISDRGTCTVSAKGNRINFTKRFYIIPEVNVVVRGGVGAVPDYEVDETGFTIVLRKSDGTGIAGVISWSANGY